MNLNVKACQHLKMPMMFEYDNGESLILRSSLNVQVTEEYIEQQRENIFHTRCHIKNKICIMIIDNGSCINISNITLVRKLT